MFGKQLIQASNSDAEAGRVSGQRAERAGILEISRSRANLDGVAQARIGEMVGHLRVGEL